MKAHISNMREEIRPDRYLLLLILLLSISYLVGMQLTGGFQVMQYFDSKLVLDTAQTARNTIRGDFFVTKYILPLGYSYFPTVTGHPDFIRYPFLILLYSVLFILFSPSAIVIKLLNALLFLVNGYLIYRFALHVQKSEPQEGDKQRFVNSRMVALFVAFVGSISLLGYFQMALSDNYEVVTYTILLIVLNAILDRTIKPFFLGLLCGVLYLTKPTFSILIFVLVVYYLIPRIPTKTWFTAGLMCVLGFLVVNSPFMIRSFVLTGQPIFALQHKVDNIKGVVLSHDQLFKTFSQAPPVLPTILEHKAEYFLRWQTRVASALQNLFQNTYWTAWFGLPFFFFYFKKHRGLAITYLAFLALHIVVVANYLTVADTTRVYTNILAFCVVLGLTGLFRFLFDLLSRALSNIKLQNTLALLVLLSFAGFIYVRDRNRLEQASPIIMPAQVVEQVRQINPPCLYSNRPYTSAWYLDIPTIYKPVDNSQMLTAGPDVCKFFLYQNDTIKGTRRFLEKNGRLVFQWEDYSFYEFGK